MNLNKTLEKEIKKVAKELNINEKYVKSILECDYRTISLTKNSNLGKVVIILRLSTSNSATPYKSVRVYNQVIKTTKEGNEELVKKMDKLVRLARVHKALKKEK